MVTRLEQLTIPDIEYSGLYFPQIFANLRRVNRVNAPDITNEDSRELFIQLEKAFALMAHYNNVLLDIVANDVFIDTAKLPESVKLLLSLINYNLLPASPAEVDILGTLTRTYTTTGTIIPAYGKVATRRSPDIPEITFENLSNIAITNRTDRISEAHQLGQIKTGTCYSYSVYSDILYFTAGNVWTTSDLNKYIRISGSVLGNNTEDLRITELLDETAPGSGIWNQARVESTSGFVSETGLTFVLSEFGANNATAYATAAGAGALDIAVGDKFYFGHSDIMFDRYDMTFNTLAQDVEARIEFYDTDEIYVNPDTVVKDSPGAGYLEFSLTTLLGTDRCNGALVRVVHLPTGAETNAHSIWDAGTNKIQIPNYLEQATPSIITTDYYVFCNWRPISILTDTTDSTIPPSAFSHTFGNNGYTSFTLPQSQDDNWQKYTLFNKADDSSRTGYMLRYRVVNTAAPVAPDILSMSFTNGSQYMLYTGVQGKLVEDSPLGSSDGNADQEFTLTRTPYLYNTISLYVDEGGGDILWEKVSSLRSSKSYDRHYVLDIQTDGTAIAKFGDGTNGKIPALGVSNISCTYRIGGDQDGNVGVGTVSVNTDLGGVFRTITNPRIGRYWIESDWNSQEALEKVKEEGPATVSTMYRATSATDCETLAQRFRTVAGVRPVIRAKAYEEALGPKTVQLVVVGPGGQAISTDNKEELEEYFNGGDTYDGILVVNHELSATNYIPRQIGIQCTVTAWPVVTESSVLQTLSALLNPSALELDRSTWTWRFGEPVYLSRIISEIFNISSGNVFNVDITSPSADVVLAPLELPVFDISTSNVVIESP